jgi:hypothetical protein
MLVKELLRVGNCGARLAGVHFHLCLKVVHDVHEPLRIHTVGVHKIRHLNRCLHLQ